MDFAAAIDTKGWKAGLKQGSKAVDDFYDGLSKKIKTLPIGKQIAQLQTLGGTIKGMARSAVAPLSGVVGAIGSIGSMALGAVGAVAGIGVAIAGLGIALGGGLLAFANSGVDRIDQLTDAASRIGVTTEALSELRYAADLSGSKAEDLDAALEKLNAGLGDTSEDGGKAADALKRIGLDSKELAALSPDAAFKKIVENFGKLESASDKTRFAMDVFGKGGVKILNTLGAGGAELERLAAEARKFGVSISQVDAAKIGAAKDSLDRAGAAVEGLGNQLAIKLAPFVEVVANKFADWFSGFVDGGKTVDIALEGIVHGVASVADTVAHLAGGFLSAFSSIASGAGKVMAALGYDGGGMLQAALDLEDAGKALSNSKPGESFIRSFETVKDEAGRIATDVAGKIKEGLGAKNPFEGLTNSLDELTKKLKEQIATFGMSAAEIDIWKLSQQGATAEQLRGVTAMSEQLKALEKAKKAEEDLKEFAKSAKEKAMSPLDKLGEQFKKLKDAFDKGLIDEKTFKMGKADALKESLSGAASQETKFAGASDIHGREAYSTVLKAMSGQGGNDGFSQLERIGQSQLEAANKQTATLDKIDRHLAAKPALEHI